MNPALVELVLYALLFFAIAFAFASRKMTQALFGPLISALQAIPVIGSALSAPFRKIEEAIVSACYSIENGADRLVGGAWHRTVEMLKATWAEFKRHALIGLKTAFYIPLLISAFHHVRNLVHQLVHAHHSVSAAIKKLEREYHGIDRRVRDLERKISKGIGHDLRIHIKALEKWEEAAKAQLASDAKAITQTIPGEITALKNFLKVIPGTNYLDWVAGIGLAALAALGLDFLKCDNAKNMSRERGCSTWGALDDLLGLVALGIVAADFEELVHEAQNLTDFSVTVFDDVFGISR